MTRERLRICMLTTFYPPFHFGGDAIAVQRLSKALVRAGHDVTVVHDVDAFRALATDGPSIVEAGDHDEGVTVVRLESRLRTLSPLLTQQAGRPVVHGRRLRRLLGDGRFDVVNFHNVSLIGGPGVLGMGGDAVRLYMAHEHWLVCPTHVLWRYRRELCTARHCIRCQLSYRRPPQLWRLTGTLERALHRVDAFIAMSEFSRDKHREFGFPHEMEVLPAFLPADDALVRDTQGPPPHPRPYFLFAGRLEQIKGVDELIACSDGYPDADVLVAGTGDHEDALRRLSANNPRVHFLGQVPPDALAAYYRDAVALIMPSRCFETFGLGLIEAFRQGTPVVARRLGPFPEIVNQAGAGLLFDTVAELQHAMRRIQGEPGLRDRLSAAGRDAFVHRWTDDVVVPRYLDIIHRAAERAGKLRGSTTQTRVVA